MNNIIDAVPNISTYKIELLGISVPDEYYQTLTDFINNSVVLDLVPSIVYKSIEIRKAYKTKPPDAIIAATALVNNYALIKRNISDFKNISGLKNYKFLWNVIRLILRLQLLFLAAYAFPIQRKTT